MLVACGVKRRFLSVVGVRTSVGRKWGGVPTPGGGRQLNAAWVRGGVVRGVSRGSSAGGAAGAGRRGRRDGAWGTRPDGGPGARRGFLRTRRTSGWRGCRLFAVSLRAEGMVRAEVGNCARAGQALPSRAEPS